MKRRWLILSIILPLALLASCAAQPLDQHPVDDRLQESEPILLRVAYDVAPEHSLHTALVELATWLETESAGMIEVELYPFFELGDDADTLVLAAEGIIQMTLPQASSLAALPTEDYPLEIPDSWRIWDSMDGFYRYDSEEAAQAAVDGQIGAQMVASLADLPGQPLTCLGFAYDGPLCIASAAGIVTTPAGLHGRKLAVCGSPAWLSACRGLGAEPVALPLSEFYPALLKGDIDAYQTTPEHLATMYLDDYSTSVTLTEHAYSFRPLLVNQEWYQSLDEEAAYLLDSAVERFIGRQHSLAQANYQSSLDDLSQRGLTIYYLTEQERDAWHSN